MEEYLRKLIAFPSVSTNQQANNQLLDYVSTFLEERGMHIARFDVDGFGSLVATTKPDDKTPKVMLTAHTDVVPGDYSLFKLKEIDGKFTGRGTYDMKFAIAAYMAVVDTLGDNLKRYDFGIMLTSDEELGGYKGVHYLLKQGYRPAIGLLPDGGDNWQIETLAKGLFHGHIDVIGKTSHGSRPWEGDSATFKLIDILTRVKALFASQSAMTTTLNISQIQGGETMNQVPAEARAGIDIRFLSTEHLTVLRKQIEEICAAHDATLTENLFGHPCITDLDDPLVAAFARSITEVTGVKVTGSTSLGATDARFFAAEDIPCIVVEPFGGDRHAKTEWMNKQACLQLPEVIQHYLDKVALRPAAH